MIPSTKDGVHIGVKSGKALTSLLRHHLRLGYGRSAQLIDIMERDGIVGSSDGARPREVLNRPDWLQDVEESHR